MLLSMFHKDAFREILLNAVNKSGIMVLCKACGKYLELLYGKQNQNSIVGNERKKEMF